MRIRDRLTPRLAPRLPRRTIRLRLTIFYASLFLVSGAGLLGFTYFLVRDADVIVATRSDGSSVSIGGGEEPKAEGLREGSVVEQQFQQRPGEGRPPRPQKLTPQQALAQARRDKLLAKQQHDAELRHLLEQMGIALALMAAVSIWLGWLVAGRVLRPLRTLDERAREISASNLHERLALEGPDDELKRLAGTFDDLLARLEASFQAQRQFVANASHELRTPLARARTLSEVALADPEASVGSLRASHRRVLAAGEAQERLIEALLTLARSERGLDHREPFDLAAVTETILASRQAEARRRGLHLRATLEPAETSGDPRLAERLIANLIDNALHYNESQGGVDVRTTTKRGEAVLTVANSGPVVPAHELERLLQPFQRLGGERTNRSDGIGLGLGLSIVNAIVTAHEASITVRAQARGGLRIEVSFPPVRADARSSDRTGARKRPRRALLRHRQKTPVSDDVPTELARIS